MTKTSNDQMLRVLDECGLSEQEARVYLASLERGPSTIAELARAAGLKRPTAYPIVSELMGKGLLAEELRGFKKKFVPAPPDALRTTMLERMNTLEKKLPELDRLYRAREIEHSVRVFHDPAAIRAAYEELLSLVMPGDFYYVLTDLDSWSALDTEYFHTFIERRRRKGVDLRLLVTKTRSRSGVEMFSTKQLRFLPEGFEVEINLAVTPKRVLMHQLEAPLMATLTSSPSLVSFHRQWFELLWVKV